MNIEAFFKLTYGLYVISSAHEGKQNGYIANTAFQVTAEPAQIAIACNKNNYTAELIQKSGFCSVSILQQDVKNDVIGTFGYKSGRDINKFEKLSYKTTSNGTPILLEDTIAWFECEVVQTVDAGSHLIFIAKILDNDLIDGSKEPLTYAYYHQVKKGKAPKNAPTYQKEETVEKSIDKYKCLLCGYIYQDEKPFKDLPDDWVCPICGGEKVDFIAV